MEEDASAPSLGRGQSELWSPHHPRHNIPPRSFPVSRWRHSSRQTSDQLIVQCPVQTIRPRPKLGRVIECLPEPHALNKNSCVAVCDAKHRHAPISSGSSFVAHRGQRKPKARPSESMRARRRAREYPCGMEIFCRASSQRFQRLSA